jgi:hypothetical protein
METLKVLSIDIGIINLGYVFAEIDQGTIKVLECNRVNITIMRHQTVAWCDCRLHHDYCIPDYLDHFIQEQSHLFEQANLILIERQPPVGITNVQDLIFSRYRNKVKLISPNTIHRHFKMTRNDYDLRKIESETITRDYLENFVNFTDNVRRHDISDAMLMIIYHSQNLVSQNVFSKSLQKSKKDFEQFRFNDFEQFRLTV